MALFDLFFRRTVSTNSADNAAEPLEKPTALQSVFGMGKYYRDRDLQIKRVRKEYRSNTRIFHKEGRSRQKNFNESLKNLDEHTMGKKANRWDLVGRTPSEADLRDPTVNFWWNENKKEKVKMNRDFDRNEREGKRELQKEFKRNLRTTSVEFQKRSFSQAA